MDITGKNIMITCGGGVGDIIMFTPALKRLKEEYGVNITFATPRNADILLGLPYVDDVAVIKRGAFLGRYRCIDKIFRQDAIIFSDWQPQLLLLARLLHIPYIAGIEREGHRLSKFLHKKILHDVYSSEQYVAKTHAEMIEEALNIKLAGDMTDIEVALPSDEVIASVDYLLNNIGLSENQEYVLLSPFTGLEQRNWNTSEAKRFVNFVTEYYHLPVVVLGTNEYKNSAENMSKYNLVGRTSITQLVELVRRSKVLVTPDSGPMHIAGALRKPVIALFSKDLPSRWAPRYNCWPVYLAYGCSPCSDDMARECQYNVKCMNDIKAEMVIELCKIVLG